MSDATQTAEEKADPTELSIGMITAWVVGVLTVLAGITQLFTGPTTGASVVYIIAGVFGIPPTRRMIEDEVNVRISRWLAIVIYLILITIAGSLMMGAA